jgi:hypothetical protein
LTESPLGCSDPVDPSAFCCPCVRPCPCPCLSRRRPSTERCRISLLSVCHEGAAGLGFVLTWFLPTTQEDLLALAIAGLVGYVSVLNLPLRRMEAKSKLERVANGFVKVRSQVQASHAHPLLN